MTIGSGNDQWEVSLECDGGYGGCEDPRTGFGVTQEEAEAAAIAAARKSAWREADGRWLCPLCYWRVCYWQAISTAKSAHSQQRADSSLRPGVGRQNHGRAGAGRPHPQKRYKSATKVPNWRRKSRTCARRGAGPCWGGGAGGGGAWVSCSRAVRQTGPHGGVSCTQGNELHAPLRLQRSPRSPHRLPLIS